MGPSAAAKTGETGAAAINFLNVDYSSFKNYRSFAA